MDNPEVQLARTLAKHIDHGDLRKSFSLRDVYRKGWTGLSRRADVEKAVAVLVDLDWLLEIEEPTQGRSRLLYIINPKIYEVPEEGTDRTARRVCDRLLSALSEGR